MSESKAYQWFRKNVLRPRDRLDRVENVMVLGMPDSNCCIEGNEFWIEIKSPTEPKRSTTALFGSNHKIEKEQANWALRQVKAGGKVYFFIETDKRRMMIDGRFADEINKATMEDLIAMSSWLAPIPTKATDCERLREMLRRK